MISCHQPAGFRPFCAAAKPRRIGVATVIPSCLPPRSVCASLGCSDRCPAADQAYGVHCSEPVRDCSLPEGDVYGTSRRHLLQSAAGGLLLALGQVPGSAQAAAGQLTLEDVTPSVAAAGPLTAREVSVISIFEAATPAVATVFDTTLVVSCVQTLSLTLHLPSVLPWLVLPNIVALVQPVQMQ